MVEGALRESCRFSPKYPWVEKEGNTRLVSGNKRLGKRTFERRWLPLKYHLSSTEWSDSSVLQMITHRLYKQGRQREKRVGLKGGKEKVGQVSKQASVRYRSPYGPGVSPMIGLNCVVKTR